MQLGTQSCRSGVYSQNDKFVCLAIRRKPSIRIEISELISMRIGHSVTYSHSVMYRHHLYIIREKTMNTLIHIGFGNIVNTAKIIAIVSPESAPVRRMVQNAKEKGTAIDATQGRKTKSVLVMENSQIVLSALLPETIAGRARNESEDLEEE